MIYSNNQRQFSHSLFFPFPIAKLEFPYVVYEIQFYKRRHCNSIQLNNVVSHAKELHYRRFTIKIYEMPLWVSELLFSYLECHKFDSYQHLYCRANYTEFLQWWLVPIIIKNLYFIFKKILNTRLHLINNY